MADNSAVRRMTDRELSLALARHYDGLQLYANGLAEGLVYEFVEAEAAILALCREALSRFRERGGVSRDLPTAEYLRKVRRRLEEIRNGVVDECLEMLEEAAMEESDAHGGFLAMFARAMGVAAVLELSAGDYEAISRYGVYGTDARRELLARIMDADVSRVFDAFSKAARDGVDVDDAIRIIEDELMKTRRYVHGAAESVANGVANDTAMAFAEENGLWLRYSAVMDARVCEECSWLDGTVYAYDDPGIPSLPRHVNCRCELVPCLPPDGEAQSGAKSAAAVDIMAFGEYLDTLSEEERSARLGGKGRPGGFRPPPEGVSLSARELARRDRRSFGLG